MKLYVHTPSQDLLEQRDYRGYLEIHDANGKSIFSCYDGEPEDNSVGRNFSDVFNVPDLMELAFNAGKNGETLEFIYVEDTEE